MADDIKKINDEINKLRKELGKKPLKPFDEKDLETAKALLSGLRSEVRELSYDLDFVAKSFKDSVNELSKQNIYLASAKKQLTGISDISRKVVEYRRGDISLSEKQLKNLQKQAKSKFEILTSDLLSGKLSEKQAEEVKNALESQELFMDALEKTIKYQKEVNKEIGLLGTGLKGISNLLSKAGFGDLAQPFEEAIEKTKDALLKTKLNKEQIKEINELQGLQNKKVKNLTESEKERKALLISIYGEDKKALNEKKKSLEDQNKELSTQTNKYKNIGKALKEQLTYSNLLDLSIKLMIDALIKADASTGELAKSFGISYKEALDIRNELSVISSTMGDVNITAGKLQESLISLNKLFGTAAMFSGELLVDYTQLTKVAGYSAEAAAGLSRITVATGTDLSDNTSKILGQAKAFNATNKLALNEKEIVEGVAKASASTTISLGMQTDRIARAVLQAKAFGATLEQIERSSQALLNFESSISAELEAELITGKNINLERARMYALNNDIEGVAREISKEVGSAADYGNMNVIAQESLAKAMGMEREELSKALIEREAIRNIGVKDAAAAREKFDKLVAMYGYEKAIKELGDEAYGKQLASQSIQERFLATVEKLKEVFVSLAEPILAIVSPIVDVLAPALSFISKVLGGIASIASAIGKTFGGFGGVLIGLIPILNNITLITRAFTLLGIKGAIAAIVRSFAFLGPLGIPAAIAAVAGLGTLISSATSKIMPAGDMIHDASSNETLVSTKKGTFKLHPDDDFLAMPDIANIAKGSNNRKNNQTTSNQNKSDMTTGNMAILERIANRPVIVQIDGKTAATEIGKRAKQFYNQSNQISYNV